MADLRERIKNILWHAISDGMVYRHDWFNGMEREPAKSMLDALVALSPQPDQNALKTLLLRHMPDGGYPKADAIVDDLMVWAQGPARPTCDHQGKVPFILTDAHPSVGVWEFKQVDLRAVFGNCPRCGTPRPATP